MFILADFGQSVQLRSDNLSIRSLIRYHGASGTIQTSVRRRLLFHKIEAPTLRDQRSGGDGKGIAIVAAKALLSIKQDTELMAAGYDGHPRPMT
jgi:hypothetical protein